MQFAVKLLISMLLISACAAVGKKIPSPAGLIATLPLTTLVVLIWLHTEDEGDYARFAAFSKGVVWEIIPSMLFFITAYGCFRKEVPLPLISMRQVKFRDFRQSHLFKQTGPHRM